jgi:putative ABC transport system permease protein
MEVYVPIAQVPEPTTIWLANNMYWVVHTDGAPLAASSAVRREIAAVDSAVPASFVRSMDQWMGGTLAQRRFNLRLVEAFAAAALLLAVVGVYAVSTVAATSRTREIGIRVALGASRREVVGLMLRGGLAPVLAALAAGTAIAVVLAPAVSGLLLASRHATWPRSRPASRFSRRQRSWQRWSRPGVRLRSTPSSRCGSSDPQNSREVPILRA